MMTIAPKLKRSKEEEKKMKLFFIDTGNKIQDFDDDDETKAESINFCQISE